MRKFSIVLLLFAGYVRHPGYADDLDRFIEGQIGFDDIQGCIHEDIPIRGAIVGALQDASFYPNEEHDLYEKLCYAHMLRAMQNYDHYALYAIYLAAKSKCSPQKLDWNSLLEKIKEGSGMDENDMLEGEKIYKDYAKRGSRGRILTPDD